MEDKLARKRGTSGRLRQIEYLVVRIEPVTNEKRKFFSASVRLCCWHSEQSLNLNICLYLIETFLKGPILAHASACALGPHISAFCQLYYSIIFCVAFGTAINPLLCFVNEAAYNGILMYIPDCFVVHFFTYYF